MVSLVRRMFEAASNSAASEREIQSVGGFDICQSASLGVGPPDAPEGADELETLDDPPESEDDDADPPADAAAPEAASAEPLDPESRESGLAGLLAPRSLRAQPVPLKWTAGAPIAFFIGEPHFGHAAGPWPWTECMTSISKPQLVQM